MSSTRRVLIRAIAAGGAGLALAGTLHAQSQPKLPSPPPVPRTQATPAPPGAPAAAPAPSAPATEAAPGSGPRDPFHPLVQPQKPEERQQQEITGLKLVGVVRDPRAPDQVRALVETPDGLGYYLRVNDEKFGGTVTAIDPDRVVFAVREQIPGGPTRVRTVELKLPKPVGQ